MAGNTKNNTTLLYETQKVSIVKVVLFFSFEHFFLMSTIQSLKNEKSYPMKMIKKALNWKNTQSKSVFKMNEFLTGHIFFMIFEPMC